MKSRNMVSWLYGKLTSDIKWQIFVLFAYYECFCLQKALSPNLPEDLAISFYIQSHKLIFVAYQLSSVHGTMRIDSCQADCAVPWLSDVLFMLTAALHMCQQLKDKVRNILYMFFFTEAILTLILYCIIFLKVNWQKVKKLLK